MPISKRKYSISAPAPVAGVDECNVCGFDPTSPMGIHKLRPMDSVLIARTCAGKSNKKKTVVAVWNECCGSFREYSTTLLGDNYGKPYAGTEDNRQEQQS